MRRSRVFSAVILAGVLAAQAATQQILPGADAPAFLTAVESWLDDNDRDSLPALSALASEGNVTARLLLSRIETTDRAPREFVKALTRTERLDLFRSKSGAGAFRPSWLKVESDAGNPIAAALLESTMLGINIAAIRRLYDIGEIEATEHLVRKVAVDGSQAERQEVARFVSPQSELAPYLQAFRHAQEGMTTGQTALQYMIATVKGVGPESGGLGDDPDTTIATSFVDTGYQAGIQTSKFGPNNQHYRVVSEWVMMAPKARAIANLCDRACSVTQVPACAVTVFGVIGGYYEVIRFDSPLEIVIPQHRFIVSERVIGMTLRRIAFVTEESGGTAFSDQELGEKSQCLGAMVAAVRKEPN